MATKTKAKNGTTTPAVPTPGKANIPLANVDLLAQLTGGVPAPDTKKSKKSRPEIPLAPDQQETLRDFGLSKTCSDVFEEHADVVKSQLNEAAMPGYVHLMFAQKGQPSSPTLAATNAKGQPDVEGMFIVQNKFKVQGETADAVIQLLVGQGVPLDAAQKLVADEISFKPVTLVRDFNELMDGSKGEEGWVPASDAEKAVAQKILSLLVQNLTPEERGLAIRSKAAIRVKDGFLDRVAGYAQTEEQLSTILAVVKPTFYPKGVKFGLSDSVTEKNNRLLAYAKKTLGIEG